MKEKANLVINLLKEYFKDRHYACYDLLCLYNENTDIYPDTFEYHPMGEFAIYIQGDKQSIEISPIGIRLVELSDYDLHNDLLDFYVLCGSCKDEKDNGSWDKAIKWLQLQIEKP